jgi:hypothetical protein
MRGKRFKAAKNKGFRCGFLPESLIFAGLLIGKTASLRVGLKAHKEQGAEVVQMHVDKRGKCGK